MQNTSDYFHCLSQLKAKLIFWLIGIVARMLESGYLFSSTVIYLFKPNEISYYIKLKSPVSVIDLLNTDLYYFL